MRESRKEAVIKIRCLRTEREREGERGEKKGMERRGRERRKKNKYAIRMMEKDRGKEQRVAYAG